MTLLVTLSCLSGVYLQFLVSRFWQYGLRGVVFLASPGESTLTGVACAVTGVWLARCVSAERPVEGPHVVLRSEKTDSELDPRGIFVGFHMSNNTFT